MGQIEEQKVEVPKKWHLNAPPEKWNEFQMKLMSSYSYAQKTLQGINFEVNYNACKKMMDRMARETIGKISLPAKQSFALSKELKYLKRQKREAKKDFEREQDQDLKGEKLDLYILKQGEVRAQIEIERAEKITHQFEKMVNSCNDLGFWRVVKYQKRDHLGGWMAVKDDNGNQILNPDDQKEYIAKYFENLFSPDKSLPFHPYHAIIKEKIEIYMSDISHDDAEYNSLPSVKEIENIISALKNNKATTEFPNEILKRGGKPMCLWIFEIVKIFWMNETVPRSWNLGVIITIYKGKGD